MCGGSGYSSYTPPPTKPSWKKFWEDMKVPTEDRGLFIEVTRGCQNVSCKLQCQARGMPSSTMRFEELNEILNFLCAVSSPEIMLYGMGDVSNYDWAGFLAIRNKKVYKLPSSTRINISPTAKDETIIALAKSGAKICFNVNTPEEAILANMKTRQLGCRLSQLIVPVAKTIDWLEILKVSTIGIEFNSYTPSWSELYVPPDVFSDGLMSLGITANPTVYKLKSGFKPVIESFANRTLIMRRCFQLDSKRIQVDIDRDDYKIWEKQQDDSLFKKLDKFGASTTTCKKCSDEVWYYNFRR